MVTVRQQCRYSIIRFTPHVETGEFANVGVVLAAPKVGFLDYQIETKRHARVTNFFDTLEPDFYRRALNLLTNELERVKGLLSEVDEHQTALDFGRTSPALYHYNEITRAREGLLNFSETRVILADDPREALQSLFGHYVERNFVTQRYRETVLEEQMKIWLNNLNAPNKFVRRQFDDGLYRATFPFVEVDERAAPLKIIKPFFLGQKDPTAIIDHGIKWKTSVERLRTAGVLPRRVLFAVEGPREGPTHLAAFEETVETLKKTKIDVLPFNRRDEILDYAAHK